MESNWEKVISDSELISLPEVYIKLQQILTRDDYSLAEISDVIGYDPAITARLLRMVNSSFFGLAAHIDTVSHAINYLGTQQVHDLVLTTSIAQTFNDMHNPAFDLHQFWRQSIYCAITARELALLCNILDSERLFVAGLLHDIGHLMMRQSIPELTLEAEVLSEQQHLPLHLAERTHIGFDFTDIGAELLNQWNLPACLVSTIKFQLHPEQATVFQLETATVHIADVLAHAFDRGLALEDSLAQIDSFALNITGINTDQIIAIDKIVKENLNSVIHLLFPQL